MRLILITLMLISAIAAVGCKTKRVAKAPESPYTDTLRIPVLYNTDSVDVFVQKIIVSDSLMEANEPAQLSIVITEQKDSVLFITVSGYENCKEAKFEVYQSHITLKSYPPRINMKIVKGDAKGCEERPAMYTIALDIRQIIKDNPEANLVFAGQTKYAHITQYK